MNINELLPALIKWRSEASVYLVKEVSVRVCGRGLEIVLTSCLKIRVDDTNDQHEVITCQAFLDTLFDCWNERSLNKDQYLSYRFDLLMNDMTNLEHARERKKKREASLLKDEIK